MPWVSLRHESLLSPHTVHGCPACVQGCQPAPRGQWGRNNKLHQLPSTFQCATPSFLPETTLGSQEHNIKQKNNIRKSAFPLLCISFQTNILFYCFLKVWLDAQQFLRLLKGNREGSPQLWELFSQTTTNTFPGTATLWEGRSIMGRKQDRRGPTPLIKSVQYGASACTGNGFRKSEQSWHYRKSVRLRTKQLPCTARVWVTVRMKSQQIIVYLRCNKVHQCIFCSQ